MMTTSNGSPSIPPLVFTVAITGHQHIIAEHHGVLQDSISKLLVNAREKILAVCGPTAPESIDRNRALTLRFLSALAPGADQIGAQAALADKQEDNRWRLNAILPFARKDYMDLASASLVSRNADDDYIESAVIQFGTLAEKAERILELADWRPGTFEKLDPYWQSRRYAALGQMLVRQADLLIAIWDGGPPNGIGGTADVVTEARRSGVPVLWICPDNAELVRSLIPSAITRHISAPDLVAHWVHGEANAEHLDHHAAEVVIDNENAALNWAVENVRLGPDEGTQKSVQRFVENEPVRSWIACDWKGSPSDGPPQFGDRAILYSVILYLVLRFKSRKLPDGSPLRKWSFRFAKAEVGFLGGFRFWPTNLYRFSNGLDTIGANSTNHRHASIANSEPILEHAERADAAATRLGNHYRSAYMAIFLLAPLAVCFALSFVFFPDHKQWFVGLEIITVCAIAGIFYRAADNDPKSSQKWPHSWRRDMHQRWLDARLIAESQRSAELLAWIGFSGRRPVKDRIISDFKADDHDLHHNERAVWSPLFANAICALPDLPNPEVRGANCAMMNPQRVSKILRAAAKVIASQAEYHELNYARLSCLHHRLDVAGLTALALSLFISASYLTLSLFYNYTHPAPTSWLKWFYELAKPWAAFAGGVGPAIAAALAGIRFQGDFERFAERSKATAAHLGALGDRAKALSKRAEDCGTVAGNGQPPLFEPLLSLMLDTQAVLDEDLADWRFAYAARPMTLG